MWKAIQTKDAVTAINIATARVLPTVGKEEEGACCITQSEGREREYTIIGSSFPSKCKTDHCVTSISRTKYQCSRQRKWIHCFAQMPVGWPAQIGVIDFV